jgi:hypothetical protein
VEGLYFPFQNSILHLLVVTQHTEAFYFLPRRGFHCSNRNIPLNIFQSDLPVLLRFSGIIDIISGDLPKGTKLLSTHLEALIELHNMTSTFARNIQHLFSESDLPILFSSLRAVYSPYETFKVRWVFLSLGRVVMKLGNWIKIATIA